MKFEDVFEKIEKNLKNREEGYFNCIPFDEMERLEKYIPGIEQSTYYLVTANSGIGKSKLVRNLFIQSPYEYVKNHPEDDIKLDIIYFSLEESKEKVILSLISKYLYYRHRLSIGIKKLQSIGRHNTISPDVLEKIKEAKDYVNEFLERVQIVDYVRNPTGMYKYVRNFMMSIGDYYDKDGNRLNKDLIVKGAGDEYTKIDKFIKNHPKHYVIVITDHVKLMSFEKDLNTTKSVIDKWSSDYCLHLRDKLGVTIVNVQQQAADKEKMQFTSTGKSIEEKLEPSLDGLGEHKLTQQDCNIAIGLFAPARYDIQEHNGYNILELRDFYRSLSILKNRDGDSNIHVPLFFNGAADVFRELPRAEDYESLQQVKNAILRIETNS